MDVVRYGPLLSVLVLLGLLPGCQAYELQGRVIEGPQSAIFLVDADDPRLQEPGLSGADLRLTLDPQRLNFRQLGTEQSETRGAFSFPVDEFGAGFLEHDVRLEARAQGYFDTFRDFQLPSSSQRVLVVLRPEDLGPGPSEEPEEEQDLPAMTPEGRGLLDETLEWGEPYME